MLLAIDIGNSNTVLGVYAGRELRAHWRLTTNRSQTADELVLLLRGLFDGARLEGTAVDAAIVASVVPPLDPVVREAVAYSFRAAPVFVGPDLDTGMPIRYRMPEDVGADRIVNAVAGFARHGGPAVIVDFGTATTFDVVSAAGEYLGGIICPGIMIAAEALFARTARLPRVEIRAPEALIGATTVGSIQSGLYYGYLSLVDGILERLTGELGSTMHVLATGGLASLLAKESRYIREVDEMLTLEGLRLIWERTQQRA